MRLFDWPQKMTFAFGALIAASGLLGLARPDWMPDALFFPPAPAGAYTRVFIRASAQASLAMGAYYMLAAWRNARDFMRWSVPIRALNGFVFTAMTLSGAAPSGWLLVAALEWSGAGATWAALRKAEK